MRRGMNQICFIVFLAGVFVIMQTGSLRAETPQEALKKLASKNVESPGVLTDAIFVAFDFDRNGTIDKNEFAMAMVKLFTELDSNHSETLEEDELPRGWTPEINAADTNQNHIVEFTEVIKIIDASFELRDRNSDGKLSRKEIKNFIKKQQEQAKGGQS